MSATIHHLGIVRRNPAGRVVNHSRECHCAICGGGLFTVHENFDGTLTAVRCAGCGAVGIEITDADPAPDGAA